MRPESWEIMLETYGQVYALVRRPERSGDSLLKNARQGARIDQAVLALHMIRFPD